MTSDAEYLTRLDETTLIGINMSFNDDFRELTGNLPFPWQAALYQRFVSGNSDNIPSSCNLPTGLGKTSVVAVWLLALAAHPDRVPRRLVYVVNRRTVVDQTTSEVERYREALRGDALQAVREQLTKLGARSLESKDKKPRSPLALSTLRGQFADNREWSADPARPAVIVGTVDMIGSRLLFSGYGVGFKGKPLHAGFLGQDVLLVHDEAHLEPAFQQLLNSVEVQQRVAERSQNGPCPRLRVIALSATTRQEENIEGGGVQSFGLTDEDRVHPKVKERFEATKLLRLVPIADEKQSVEKIAEIALEHGKNGDGQDSNSAVLIFVRRLDDVSKVCARLTDKKKSGVSDNQVRQLTGTMRGKERDDFAKRDPVFTRYLPEKSRNPEVPPTVGTVYLVCTSAGEVGVDISADHLVCDLSPFDSMAQRFGRVNRYGNRPDTRIDVVHPTEFGKQDKKTGELKTDESDKRRRKTLWLLRKLPELPSGGNEPIFDASPKALRDLMGRFTPLELELPVLAVSDDDFHRTKQALARKLITSAYTPEPTILPASDILFDAWAMTSIRQEMPGRPDVAPYLHGIADELPQTSIAWRVELDLLAKEPNPQRTLQAIFKAHRIRPHETVTVNSYRVAEFFKEITRKRDDLKDTRVALLFARELTLTKIGDLMKNDGPLNADPTLILPASLGYLNRAGMLDAEAVPVEPQESSTPRSLDVADQPGYEPDLDLPSRVRVLIKRREDDRWTAEALIPQANIATLPDPGDDFETSTKLVNELRGDQYRVRLVQPIRFNDDDEVVESLVLLVPSRQVPERDEQELNQHVEKVEDFARRIADKLKLSAPFRAALLFAAKWHDEGKKATLWQRYIGGTGSEPYIAKSAKWCDPRKLSGYRHEFGSLLRLEHEQSALHPAGCNLPDDPHIRDLALHLIAAHHGHARPHFSHSFDKEFSAPECEATYLETIRRFARLQRQYGRWGLAYLESLLRAADAAASAGLETDDELEDDNGGDA